MAPKIGAKLNKRIDKLDETRRNSTNLPNKNSINETKLHSPYIDLHRTTLYCTFTLKKPKKQKGRRKSKTT